MRQSMSRQRWRGGDRPAAETTGVVLGTWDPSRNGPSPGLFRGLPHKLMGGSRCHAQCPML